MDNGSTSTSLMFNGHCFRFETKEAEEDFLETTFNASMNRAALYRDIMLSTTESMLEDIFKEITPEEKLLGATVLSVKYGKIYDPSSKLFSTADPTKLMEEGKI